MRAVSARMWSDPTHDDIEKEESFVGTRLRALVAEHDVALRRRVSEALMRDGFVVSHARDGFELIEILQATMSEEGSGPELIFADLTLPGFGGLDALRALRAVLPDALLLVTSPERDASTLAAAHAAGVYDVLAQPIDLTALHAALACVPMRD